MKFYPNCKSESYCRVTKKPELRTTANGKEVVKMSIYCGGGKSEKQEDGTYKEIYPNLKKWFVIWGDKAQKACKLIDEGMLLRITAYEKAEIVPELKGKPKHFNNYALVDDIFVLEVNEEYEILGEKSVFNGKS